MAFDWNDFEVFDGPCTVDRNRFRPAVPANIDADVANFCAWINTLRHQLARNPPGPSGIPAGREALVLSLLNSFFPYPGPFK
jgi:hypothetical protein